MIGLRLAWGEAAEAEACSDEERVTALVAAGRDWVRDQPFEALEDLDGQGEAMDIAMCITGLSYAGAERWGDYVYGGMHLEMEHRLTTES